MLGYIQIHCNDCGMDFDPDELSSYTEHIGDCFGFPAYQTYSVCPLCGSEDLEEITVYPEGEEDYE